jgi:putative acetyltransferase
VLRSRERAVSEMHPRRGLDGGQEIGPQAHGLEDGGDGAARALRLGSRVQRGQRAFGVRLLDHSYTCHRLDCPNDRPGFAVTLTGALSLSIAAESFDSPDARRLVAALDAGLAALYPPEQRFGPNLKPEHLEAGRGTFLVARDYGEAVGCGALRILDPTTAEVKRMYVEPEHRGKGVGWALLGGLEAAASTMSVERLVLETGVHQEAAIALYCRAGFTQLDCWGEYATAPTSVCFEKQL